MTWMNILAEIRHFPENQTPSEGSYATVVLGLLAGFVALILLVSLIRMFKRCPSNKILVIYGKTGRGAAKCVHGGAAFVWPVFQASSFLELDPFVVPVDLTSALSQENIRVKVPTTVTAAISIVPGVMENAAIRLLGLTRQQIQDQAQNIILGQMRAVIATMKIDEINRDRQAFMAKVSEAVTVELEKIGLMVININIKDIEDESGYLQALGRKAAAEAINQANVDVSEQERKGQIGVAERERDRRKAVAAANADAVVGEQSAERDRRQQVANLEAQAVQTETEANARKAAFIASQKVAEADARSKAESAARSADGQIRVAEQVAQKLAEEARALREAARLKAEVIVPAEAARSQVVIQSEAEKQLKTLIAEGEANAILVKMKAEAEGTKAVLDAKAAGYGNLIQAAAQDPAAATTLLVIERLADVARIQAEAIQNLPLEKVIVWDGGGQGGGLSDLGKRLIGVLPPMHEIARMAGLDLPDFLGQIRPRAGAGADPAADKPKPAGEKPKA
jgi:flotillin